MRLFFYLFFFSPLGGELAKLLLNLSFRLSLYFLLIIFDFFRDYLVQGPSCYLHNFQLHLLINIQKTLSDFSSVFERAFEQGLCHKCFTSILKILQLSSKTIFVTFFSEPYLAIFEFRCTFFRLNKIKFTG